MAGTWDAQNKILPGAYINLKTNTPLSITVGERGIAVLLQEMSVGAAGELYTVTATENDYPEGVTSTDKFLVNEVLKGAKSVLVYNLGTEEHIEIETALSALRTESFNVICYPYDGEPYNENKLIIKTWVDEMINDEGVGMQCVMANYAADNENFINVTQGIKLANGTELTPAQTTAWVAGVTAGAQIYQSNTGRKYMGAIDVIPRMTRTEMEAAITAGKFIFKVDTAQNVTAVYDINSLTTVSVEKDEKFKKNRFIRTNNGIRKDINEIFESNYKGKGQNEPGDRSLQRSSYIDYFNELQRLKAITEFTPEDIEVLEGEKRDAVLVNVWIKQVDSTEKMYMNVNLT